MALTEEMVEEIKAQIAGLPPGEQQKKLQEILSKLTPEEREELMGGQQQCPFCMMAEGKINVKKVYEDEVCMAILDINPANPGHTLLFPKKHCQLLSQMEDKDVGHIFMVANKVAASLFETLGAPGTNITVANGPAAGQTAPHLLINIIPRFSGDKVAIGWQGRKMSEEEMEAVAKKISAKPVSLKKPDIVIKRIEPEKGKQSVRQTRVA